MVFTEKLLPNQLSDVYIARHKFLSHIPVRSLLYHAHEKFLSMNEIYSMILFERSFQSHCLYNSLKWMFYCKVQYIIYDLTAIPP